MRTGSNLHATTVAACVILTTVTGSCRRGPVGREQSDPQQRPTPNFRGDEKVGENSFSRMLRKGMTRNGVLAKLGEPITEWQLDDGTTVLLYLEFPPKELRKFAANGVQVFLVQDKVESWTPVYSMMQPPQGAPKDANPK